ncbi:MAG: DUF2218 domain-containing protein [Actinomycetes bacterium]
MPTGYADVSTSSPQRYASELMQQLTRSQPSAVEPPRQVDENTRVLQVDLTEVSVTVAPALISLQVHAPDDESLAQTEELVAGILDALDEPSELVVEWHRETS